MSIVPFFAGFGTAALVAIATLTVTHDDVWVTTAEVRRDNVLDFIKKQLRRKQDAHAGFKDDDGCFIFHDLTIQFAVDMYSFTSVELGQSMNELLCYGWTMPKDFMASD